MDNNALKTAADEAAKPKATTAVTTQAKKPAPAIYAAGLLEKKMAEISRAMPSHTLSAERFVRLVTTAMSVNPKLAQAAVTSPETLLGSVMTAAQLGVEPNTPLGQAYLIPFNNSVNVNGQWVKKLQVSFQLGYKGLIDLAYRSGEVMSICAEVVYEEDEYEYELGLNQKLVHRPYRGYDRGKPVAYYAVITTKNNAKISKWMWYEEVMEHAKRFSKSYNAKTGKFSGPWESDFNAMAKKTVLKAALQFAPMKSDFVSVVGADNTVKTYGNGHNDMLHTKNDDVIDVDATDEKTVEKLENQRSAEEGGEKDE